MKLYIAGPMSGLPDHNWSAFNREAELLRAAGYEVVNPVDCNGTYEEAKALPYEQCLKNDIRAMLECDGVALLPGWGNSFGARLEAQLATSLKMEVREAVTWRNPIVTSLLGDVG